MEKEAASDSESLPSSATLGGMASKHSRTKLALLAVSVSTQWLGFYFQNEADKNFDRYEAAADPAKAAEYWDNTRRNDRFTTVSLSVSYAALAGLIYYVVWK